MNYKYDVFISYSRKDTGIADKICQTFDQVGISYFIDRLGIGGGMEFPAVLAKAIKESKVFLYLASKNSYESKFTQSEIVYAFNKKQKQDIIPYIIDGSTLPDELEFTFSAINWRQMDIHPIDIIVNDIFIKIGKPPVQPFQKEGLQSSDSESIKQSRKEEQDNHQQDLVDSQQEESEEKPTFSLLRWAIPLAVLLTVGLLVFFWNKSSEGEHVSEETVGTLYPDNNNPNAIDKDFSSASGEENDGGDSQVLEKRSKKSVTMQAPPKKLTVQNVEYRDNLKSQAGNTYEPFNMLDGNLRTAWAISLDKASYEGGRLYGPTFTVRCKKLSHIVLCNGYAKNDASYKNNSRAAHIIFCNVDNMSGVDDESSLLYEGILKDTPEPQTLSINEKANKNIKQIQMIFPVDGLRRGAKWNDLCISEVEFWGWE